MTLRGSARGSYLENLPQHGQIFSKMSKICPRLIEKLKNLAKSCPNPPKIHPKPSQNPPKSIQNRSKRPFGPHLGSMLEKRLIQIAQKIAKKRPKVSKRAPRPSQILPKRTPRPSQIQFKSHFGAFFFTSKIYIDFSSFFFGFFDDFYELNPYETLRGRTNFGLRAFAR